jgi:predicted N-formylglutamate amidohydrolase
MVLTNNIEVLDRNKRIELFYLQYYNLLSESLLFVKPRYIISVHSFVPYYKEEPLNNYEIGLIFRNKGTLVDKMYNAITSAGIRCKLNEPYDMKSGNCHAQDSMTSWNLPEIPEVILLNCRSDLATKRKWRKQMLNIISPVIAELSIQNKKE